MEFGCVDNWFMALVQVCIPMWEGLLACYLWCFMQTCFRMVRTASACLHRLVFILYPGVACAFFCQ